MLISLSNKFIFIANPKTASTAIEKALRPWSDVALVESRFGKHQSFLEIETRFAWLLSLVDPSEWFVFSVMRDPVDFMVSLYNSHMNPKFREQTDLYTGTLDFEGFLNDWTRVNDDQSRQQHTRLLDGNNCIAVNYIIGYDNLVEGLRFVGERIGIDSLVLLGTENESTADFSRASLTTEQRDRITRHFAQDQAILKRYCDRPLTSRSKLTLYDADTELGRGQPMSTMQLNLDKEFSAPGVRPASRSLSINDPERIVEPSADDCAFGSIRSEATSTAVSERDVQLAYEFILGRGAENASVLAEHVKHRLSRKDLRTVLMASAEHRAQLARELGAVAAKPLGWPKMDIEVDVPTETLAAMIRHTERNWALLGEREPHWSVLTHEKFKAGEIGENIDEFYASGEDAISYFTHAADRAGVNYRELRRCFELGCGVGRLSLRLARIFPELLAVDISAPHLRLAAEAINRAGLKNVDLRLVDTIGKVEALPTFDCFVSIIVLQHNPPPVIAFLLRTILAKLNPGGLAYFQVPTYCKNAAFNAEVYIRSAATTGEMELHVIPQAVIWRLADEANCQLLDVREDGWTGVPDGISNSILLMKRP